MVPERRNLIKVLLFLDVGGSMDPHVRTVEELFSAARSEFKHLEYFYFHNCLYEGVWKDNRRRHTECIDTWDVLHTYPADYKVVFVGDASMSPYEITYPAVASSIGTKSRGGCGCNASSTFTRTPSGSIPCRRRRGIPWPRSRWWARSWAGTCTR